MGTGQFDISIHHQPEDIKTVWQNLQHTGFCTLEQTYEWSTTWLDVYASFESIEPAIVLGIDKHDDTPAFLLPLCIVRRFGCRKLVWMSTGHLTYGTGLFSDAFLNAQSSDLTDLWPKILAKIGNVDLVFLECQPKSFFGQGLPMAALARVPAANSSYSFNLTADYDKLYQAKRSSSTRRSNAKRERNLKKSGDVWFGLPQSPDDTKQVIDTMFRQQRARLGGQGVKSVFSVAREKFTNALIGKTFKDGTPLLLPYHLKVDGKIRAVLLGAQFDKTYWALIASLTGDGEFARFSPGEIALRRMIEDLCKKKFVRFDFALGDSPYKRHWSDEEILLYETIATTGIKGLPLTAFLWSKTTIKRSIKSNHLVLAAMKRIRRALFSR